MAVEYSSPEEFEYIVVGAGIQGSFTAYHLSKRSKSTVLIEQFMLPHSRGSSHGQTRIIRKAYSQSYYTRMMAECYQLWSQLETEAHTQLYRQTGMLVLGSVNNPEFQQYKQSLVETQTLVETLTAQEFSRRFPDVKLSKEESVILDTSAGVLYADRALRAVQDIFRRSGGVIRDGERVVDIKPGSLVTVTTASGVYRAKSLVITAGPWANKILGLLGLQLPLKTLRINVCYWKEKIPGTYGISQKFPCIIGVNLNDMKHHIYGLPSNEYPGLVKICYHTGAESDPDRRDVAVETPLPDVQLLSDCVSKYFPGLDPKPANTPDDDFILDCHPAHSNIVIGAGFSGHGFKLAPVVGKVLCELSMGETLSYDLSPFKIGRFAPKLKSAL
ncbi:peroxisomal sarcosine oxidase isoform X2 [Latimeria chalumnae]|uniref:peroxisomal sarcosine oxidase isoform X2 n=1 Tax=Latimeria chalumnae TaxID=7897 RepID=UPI0002519A07|nr:PREDICTED: peroxisomal sarcosine oxidase isoform X2 [Latimeria chalumnae]|eukprot:XP_005997043.1 PREDICTED: peroxisomal sarcosine oxidase isoform X2 [Latimeria chalumnae]